MDVLMRCLYLDTCKKPSCANKVAICSREIEFRINSTEPCFLKSNYDRKNPVIATPLNFLTPSE